MEKENFWQRKGGQVCLKSKRRMIGTKIEKSMCTFLFKNKATVNLMQKINFGKQWKICPDV